MINDFIRSLNEPYVNNDCLSIHRFKEIDNSYLAEIHRRHIAGQINVLSCITILRASVNDNLNSGLIRQWKRCCVGVATYLLTPRLSIETDRRVAAGVVVRLSAYCNSQHPGYSHFTSSAKEISQILLQNTPPDLRSGGHLAIDPDSVDPMTVWAVAKGPDDSGRDVNEARRVASRLINFMAKMDFRDGLEVERSSFAKAIRRPGLFDAFDVNSLNVDAVAGIVTIELPAVQKILDLGFKIGVTYHPRRKTMSNSESRKAWFNALRVV